MCSMPLTVVVIARSEMVTMRPSISFADSPLYSQMTETTGMLMSGKMSVGVRAIVSAPRMRDQDRQHREGVRPAQCEADDPHVTPYGAPSVLEGDPCAPAAP